MENNNYENNFNIKEDNTFSEFKSFKAENYFIKENRSFSNDFHVNEINKSINSNIKSQEIKGEKPIDNINKLTKLTENITSTIASHSSVVVTTAVAVVSASVVGIIPSIDIGTEVKVMAESIKNMPLVNEIVVEGKIAHVDLNYRYFALVDQYMGEELLEIDEECELFIDDQGNFTFNVDAYYGLTSYQYDIFYKKSETSDDLLLYSSLVNNFNLSQEYNATYNKVKPNESKFTFNDDGTINVHIETNFASEYDYAYHYGLNILDKEGIIHAQYVGSDKSIDLTLDNDIEQVFYEYIDIGEFNDTFHEYNRYLIDDVSVVKLPTFNLSESFDFVDDKFAILYQLDSIYDYSSLSLDLTLSNGSKTIDKHISGLSEKALILLDEFDEEIGDLTITGNLNLQDEMIDNYPHKIKIQEYNYTMNYYFDVTNVQVDAYEDGADFMPVTLDFDYRLPSTYKMKIKDSNGNFDETVVINSHCYLPASMTNGDGGTIDITILDSNNNIFDNKSYDILSYDVANSQYLITTQVNNINPGNSLVTYNDDGTINLYRNVGFVSNSPNAYYDAFIFENEIIDDVTNEKTYEGAIHNISNSNYSILENIEERQYKFYYFDVLKLNEVNYYLKKGYPSGSINVSTLLVNVTGTYDNVTNKTTITITNNSSASISNECLINGITYELNNSGMESSIIIDGNVINEQITIYASLYHDNYAIIKEAIPLIGNEYKAYNLTINE